MKIKLELLINKPRADIWKFFTDLEKIKLWQPSLQDIETISGTSGQPGSSSKWTYEENGREFSLTEKVLERDEPARFESEFENEFATNIVNNLFSQEGDGTLWIQETTYTFKTLLMKIMGRVLKKKYVARSQKEMQRFKEAIEGSDMHNPNIMDSATDFTNSHGE